MAETGGNGPELKAIVMDCGSGSCKAGFSGEQQPRVVFAAMAGKPTVSAPGQKDLYVGDEAFQKRAQLKVVRPVVRGVVERWDEMQQLWWHALSEKLQADPGDYGCCLTEVCMNPKSSREKLTQTFFETFKSQAFYLAIQGVLSLYAAGRTTGLVVDCGEGLTSVVPINEGYIVPHAVLEMPLAGSEVSLYLAKLLTAKGWHLQTSVGEDVVRDIKETQCEVALEMPQSAIPSEILYKLPDGQELPLGPEVQKAPELLFAPGLDGYTPGLNGKYYAGLPELIYDSISKCDADIRKELYPGIVLNGGSTLFRGLVERVNHEVAALAPSHMLAKAILLPEPKIGVWLGGSIITSLAVFQSSWIKKEEYDEAGPQIIHRKCYYPSSLVVSTSFKRLVGLLFVEELASADPMLEVSEQPP